jgi:hypothetical protein
MIVILDKEDIRKSGMEKQLVNGYLDRTNENPRYEVTSTCIGYYIQHMKYHALLGKFMGIWPLEKAMML